MKQFATPLSILVALLIALFCMAAFDKPASPLNGYWLLHSNGPLVPFNAIDHEHKGWCPVEWAYFTNDSLPKIVTAYTVPSKMAIAASGQYWASGLASYINIPKASIYPGETNEFWHTEDHFITNHWPELNHNAELIYVREIEKCKLGRNKGEDLYARCRVRMWSGTTAYIEGEAWLLCSELTNKATLLRWQ